MPPYSMPNPFSFLTVKRRIAAQRRAAKARSDAIDRQLEEDSRRLKTEVKVLLLGSSKSGKSSVIKHMKLIHQNGFTDVERIAYRPTIYQNVLDGAQTIVLSIRRFGYNYVDPNNEDNAGRILDYRIDPTPSPIFSPDIAQAIHQLWRDPIILRLMDRRDEILLIDDAEYFVTNIQRITAPDYLPTDNDILQARPKTAGMTETRFTMGNLRIDIVDVDGLRSERKKWIHYFEDITTIIFCAALSDYDQVLVEDRSQNRLVESIVLFESIINSRWFVRTSIILFLTNAHEFKIKLSKIPLERYFPDYSGGADVNKAAKYILWRFTQTNRARLSIYPHLVQPTDTANVRLVFAAVKETILQNALRECGNYPEVL